MSNKEAEQADIWHSLSVKEAASRLNLANTESGLAQAEAQKRLTTYGPNLLRKEKKEPFWEELLEEAKEPMILLLFVTGIFYGIIGGLEDAIVIAVVIITLLVVEVANEYRAENAIASLRKLGEPLALVRRDGLYKEILTEQVVPGDVILLKAGRRVPADARMTESHGIAFRLAGWVG
ncbi:MAG: cation-transporting P-type ATPase [Thaumarchaeota archaeon]|nr:cation-transporting P-type ATPase [Nitrososphaerota archaeon]